MTEGNNGSRHSSFYCKTCDTYVSNDDPDKLLEHPDHDLIKLEDGEEDPGVLLDFEKNDIELADSSAKTTKKKKEDGDERSELKKLFDIALIRIKKIVISENNQNEVYAIIENNSHVETLNLNTQRARYWLNDLYRREVNINDIHSDDFYKSVLHALISKAQMDGTERSKIYNRVAQSNCSIYYDLGNTKWEAVRITKNNIEIISLNVDSPIFRRSQSLYEQVRPVFDDSAALDKLADLLHIVQNDRLVFKVNLVALLLESYPIPIMVFDGNSGSLKTTVTATVKRIIDPNGNSKEDNVSTIYAKSEDLILQIYNRYLASFDNVSKIGQEMSDILCKAITGSSNPKRELYTNADETILSYRRKIVLNGVVPTLDYTDLRERLLFFSRDTIDEKNRITEEEFEQKFHSLLPSVLGAIFQTLKDAMNLYSQIKNEIKPQSRMADFEIWGEAIARSLGCKQDQFLESYHNKLKEGTLNAKDQYPIVNIIQNFMEDKKEFESTISSLYMTIKELAERDGIEVNSKYVHFPKSSNQLSRELKLVNPLLNNLGFVVELSHYTKNDGKYTKNASIVKIKKKDCHNTSEDIPKTSDSENLLEYVKKPSLPSLPYHDENQVQNKGEKREANSDQSLPPDSHLEIPENIKENDSGEDGKGGEGILLKSSEAFKNEPTIAIVNHTHFVCESCGAGPFGLLESSKSSGNILEYHRNLNHNIKYLTESEI